MKKATGSAPWEKAMTPSKGPPVTMQEVSSERASASLQLNRFRNN